MEVNMFQLRPHNSLFVWELKADKNDQVMQLTENNNNTFTIIAKEHIPTFGR